MVSISLAERFRLPRFFVRLGVAAVAAPLLLALSACHKTVTDPKDPAFIVAESKDFTITRAQLDTQIDGFLKQQQKSLHDIDPAKVPLLETEILKNMVIQKLVLAKAATMNLQGVDKESADTFDKIKSQFPSEADFESKLKSAGMTVDDAKKQIHDRVVLQKVLEKDAFQNVQPSDAEINAFYLQNQDKLTTPEKIRISRVMIMADDKTTPADRAAKKKAIDKAHARVLKGEDFAKVATAVSEDRYSAPKGGDIGYTQRGENEANFDEVAFATKPGEVSAVFETPMGFQFLKVTDVHPGGVVPIAQARDTIARYLEKMNQRKAMDNYATKLLADGGVVFHLKQVDASQLPGAMPAAPASATPVPATPPAPTDTSAPSPPPSTNAGQ